RERFGPDQRDFAGLTGIGVATLSRWERGRLLQTRAMDRYLRLLDVLPQATQFLTTLQKPGQESTGFQLSPEEEAAAARAVHNGKGVPKFRCLEPSEEELDQSSPG